MKNSITLSNDEILIKEYIAKGKGLFNDGEIKKAFKAFNKAIFLNSEYAQAYLVKAEAHIEMYEVEEAEKCIAQYLKLVPGDAKGYWQLVVLHDLTGDFDKCLYYCDKILESHEKNINIYLKKAEVLVLLYDFNKAIEFFDICLKIDPNCYEALCGKDHAQLSLCNSKMLPLGK